MCCTVGEPSSYRPNPNDFRSAEDAMKDKFKSESSSLRKPPLPPDPLEAADCVFPKELSAC